MLMFRWLPAEEAWLERRVIADQGKTSTSDKQWLKSIIDDFRREFPCVPYTKVDGVVETQVEMITRWSQIPRRINRWIKNHQHSILAKHACNQPQASLVRLASKPTKRHRAKNARDMAKAHDDKVRQAWKDLTEKVKSEEITQSERWRRYNAVVQEVLADEASFARYTAMAEEANTGSSPLGAQGGDHAPAGLSMFAYIPPPPDATRRDNAEAMLADSTGQEPLIAPVVLPSDNPGPLAIVPSPNTTLQPTSYAMQYPTFGDSFSQSRNTHIGSSSKDSFFVDHSSKWSPSYVVKPLTVEESPHRRTHAHAANEPPLIPASSSIPSSRETPSYSTNHRYKLLTDEAIDASDMEHNAPTHTVSVYRSLSTDDRYTPISLHEWAPSDSWHLQKAMRGHSSEVNCVAFSHDGKSIVSGSCDCTIRVWNVETGEPICGPLTGHTHWILAIAYSPDDRRLVSGSGDRTVRIWDVETGEMLLAFSRHIHPVWSVAFSSTGDRIISSDSVFNVLLWDADSVHNVLQLEMTNHPVSSLSFTDDDEFIVGTHEQQLTVWSGHSGKRILPTLQELAGLDITWFGAGALYTCMNGKVRKWNEAGENGILSYQSGLSPDRKLIVSSDRDYGLSFYAHGSPSEEVRPVGDMNNSTLHTLHFDTEWPLSRLLYTNRHTPMQPSYVQSSADKSPHVLEIAQNERMDQTHLPHISASRYPSPLDDILSDVTNDTPLDRSHDWSPTGEWYLQRMLRVHNAVCIAFSHNGKLIASGSADNTVRLLNVETGHSVGETLRGHTGLVRSVAFSPDDRSIVSGSSDRTVRIWDVQKGNQLYVFTKHTNTVLSMAFSFDGGTVVSSDYDNNVFIWGATSDINVQLEEPIRRVLSVYISANDRFVVGTHHKDLSVWDAKTGKLVPILLQGPDLECFWFWDDALYACKDGKVRKWHGECNSILQSTAALSHNRKWIASLVSLDNIVFYTRDTSPEDIFLFDHIVLFSRDPPREKRLLVGDIDLPPQFTLIEADSEDEASSPTNH